MGDGAGAGSAVVGAGFRRSGRGNPGKALSRRFVEAGEVTPGGTGTPLQAHTGRLGPLEELGEGHEMRVGRKLGPGLHGASPSPIVLLARCSLQLCDTARMGDFNDPTFDLSPAEVARRMEEEDLILVDVREQYEWDAGRVPGSQHIALDKVASAAPSIPRDHPVAFICLSGARSALVTEAFRKAGYDAYNVAGGFGLWFQAGLPTEPEGATVAPH